MNSSNQDSCLPVWVRSIICLGPTCALTLLCAGQAFGVAVSPMAFLPLAALHWRLCAAVLGLPPTPLLIGWTKSNDKRT